MQECIFTFRKTVFGFFLLSGLLFLQPAAFAETSSADRTQNAEEEDYSQTPYTQYGEFHEDSEEAAETRFLQYGRLFGVSLGGGYEGVSGNRGNLWEGGFPTIELKVHYWFDFNLSLTLGLMTGTHVYSLNNGADVVDVSTSRLGVDLRYALDVTHLSAAVTFANPYFFAGAGSMTKAESNNTANEVDSDSALALSLGAGLEFAVKPRQVYVQLEGRTVFATFKDTNSGKFATSGGVPDQKGVFYTVGANLLFTW